MTSALLDAAERVEAAAATALANGGPSQAASTGPPTGELGTQLRYSSLPTFGALLEDDEYAPELMWPQSVRTYDRMRNDSQIEALLAAVTLPIRRRRWLIDPNDAPADLVAALSEDLGLPVRGQETRPKRRNRDQFSWSRHVFHVLLGLVYGHYYFEKFGQVRGNRWRMENIAPRPPRTLGEIAMTPHGDLRFIRQISVASFTDPIPQQLDANRLVPYVWDREGANWAGRSMLRACFRDWVTKDRLIRVDALKHERNGMGVPTAIATQPGVEQAALDAGGLIAAQWRAGETSAAALPYGIDIQLKGVQGSIPDTNASIRRSDEAMARRFLAMFVQLGTTETGSRALGSEFIDFFALAGDSVADWVCDATNDGFVEDFARWGWGDQDSIPLVVSERDEAPELSATDLVGLVHAGALTLDAELEDWIREKFDVPARGPNTPDPMPSPTVRMTEVMPPGGSQVNPGGSGLPIMKRGGLTGTTVPQTAGESAGVAQQLAAAAPRQPTPVEVAASTDFGQLDEQWKTGLQRLLAAWGAISTVQRQQLADQIAQTTDLEALARIAATPQGAELLHQHMVVLLEQGAAGALAEGARQGVNAPTPDLRAARDLLARRAQAVVDLLAKSISDAAGRKAIQLSGGTLTAGDVAAQVRDHLAGLSDTYLSDQLGGALTAAQNTGRREAFGGFPQGTTFYASELNDASTCAACSSVDGTQYQTLGDAEQDYSSGGFNDCSGGPRCRGTLISVAPGESPTDV